MLSEETNEPSIIINDVWKVGSKIGSGSYGSIFEGENLINGKKIAVKKFRDNSIEDGISSSTLREIISLKKLNHKTIISILDVITSSQTVYIVQELMQMDLHCFITKFTTKIPIKVTKNILFQILSGISYIHSNNYFHRDIKPRNILISIPNDDIEKWVRDNPPIVKITDFGFCRIFIGSEKKYTKDTMTPLYRAPEVLLGEVQYTCKVDIWSIGCIFAEMVLGTPLFNGCETEVDIIKRIFAFFDIEPKACPFKELCRKSLPTKKDKWTDKFPNLNESGLDLMERMLQIDPDKRISSQEALLHPFFNKTL